jgi:hypothetical protein
MSTETTSISRLFIGTASLLSGDPSLYPSPLPERKRDEILERGFAPLFFYSPSLDKGRGQGGWVTKQSLLYPYYPVLSYGYDIILS